MRKCDDYLTCTGYKYAPEQFRAYLIKGFKTNKRGQRVPIYAEIELDATERSDCGLAYVNGKESAIKALKKVIRKRERRLQPYMTYGNYLVNSDRYVFTRDLIFPDALNNRLLAYKEWKRCCEQNNWMYEAYTVETGTFIPGRDNKPETRTELIPIDRNRHIRLRCVANDLYNETIYRN